MAKLRRTKKKNIPRQIELSIKAQPDMFTCGPTCLHALYNLYGDAIELEHTIREVRRLDNGGTLEVLLGIHALRRGYAARIHSYHLQIFDPTWFSLSPGELHRRLHARMEARPEYRHVIEGYMELVELGGILEFVELTPSLLRKYLAKNIPILTGLSSTYLYRSSRESGPDDHDDDISGDPQGHFVVLTGYDKRERTVFVADPMENNPAFKSRTYAVSMDRLLCSILLGILTHDGNLLIVQPAEAEPPALYVNPDRRQ
jgi:hypothetical protein